MQNNILDQVAKEIEKARQSGYAEGWDAAVQAITAAAAGKKASKAISDGDSITKDNASRHSLHEGSTSSKVAEYIKNNPGQTGVEVVRGLMSVDDSINERTVRTAFSRLKGKLIRKNRKKWYPM